VITVDNTTIGIYDFNAAPYALGDVATWIENVAITAEESQSISTEIFIITGPDQKYSAQSFINRENYHHHFGDLFPVFLFTPNLSKIHIYDGSHRLFGMVQLFQLLKQRKNGNDIVHTWPSVNDTIRKKWVYSSHSRINSFYNKNRYIPRLSISPEFSGMYEYPITQIINDKTIISVNIRQRKNYPDYRNTSGDTAHLLRDASIQEWYDFFAYNEINNPDCLFLILGGYSEWDNKLFRFNNVIIPRTKGMNLYDEIALLLNSDMFCGSSSGFAQIATFSTVPYIITNMQPRAVNDALIPFGSPRYPFALDNQYLFWEREKTDQLINQFERVLKSIRT